MNRNILIPSTVINKDNKSLFNSLILSKAQPKTNRFSVIRRERRFVNLGEKHTRQIFFIISEFSGKVRLYRLSEKAKHRPERP